MINKLTYIQIQKIMMWISMFIFGILAITHPDYGWFFLSGWMLGGVTLAAWKLSEDERKESIQR